MPGAIQLLAEPKKAANSQLLLIRLFWHDYCFLNLSKVSAFTNENNLSAKGRLG